MRPDQRNASGHGETAAERDEHAPSTARVLALLDASRHSLAALSAAVDLAASRQAELVALFVEDLDLLRCAGFPFSCEVGAQSGMARPLSLRGLETSLERQVQRIHQALDAAVAGRELRHSLKVSRGRVVAEALALAGDDDVLVMGKAGASGQWGVRLGSTSRALILEAPCPVLIWDEIHPLQRGPLLVVSDQQHPEPPALGWLADSGLFDTLERLSVADALALEHRLAHARRGALLLDRTQLKHLVDEDSELINRIPIPIVVVP
ncbi:universal stress protein [Litchfieldella rifensis]|uniref:Universal stress protein n=1 Tax=Litchfieldella rifensis TaxID=762643 RepID=A0ABV7LPZ8_9GAMM